MPGIANSWVEPFINARGPLAEWNKVMQETTGSSEDERETGVSTPPVFTRLDWACLGGLVLLGLLLRVWGIQNESAWYDEVLSLRHLHEPNLFAFLRNHVSSLR